MSERLAQVGCSPHHGCFVGGGHNRSVSEQICPHCGQPAPPEHVLPCQWPVRPYRSEGYSYVVAVLSSTADHPVITHHARSRAAAYRAARHPVTGRLSLFGTSEVRVIGVGGRVTDRWARDRKGRMRYTDVARVLRGREQGIDAADPLPSSEPSLGLF